MDDADFLHTLTPAESDALEDMGEPGTYAAGEVIFEEGGTADCVLLVRAGRVRVTPRPATARRSCWPSAGRASCSASCPGIDGQPRSASVTALEEVRGLVVPLRAFRGFLMDHPRAALSLLELLSRRLREAEARAPVSEAGPSTRAVHAGPPAPEQGTPLTPGPVLAAPFHLQGAVDAAPYGYGRDGNPTWTGRRDRARARSRTPRASSSPPGWPRSARCSSRRSGAGDVLVGVRDGYPGVRGVADRPAGAARRRGAPRADGHRGDRRRLRRRRDGVGRDAVEPGARRLRHRRRRGAAHAAGARLAVDNTLCTPLGQRPLDLGADAVMYSATKALSGHSDIVLGAVATRDPSWAEALRKHRSQGGAIAGRFEAWCSTARWPRSRWARPPDRERAARSPHRCGATRTCATCATRAAAPGRRSAQMP